MSTDDLFRFTTISLFYLLLCQLVAALLPEGHRETCLCVRKTPPCEMWPFLLDRFAQLDSVSACGYAPNPRHPTIFIVEDVSHLQKPCSVLAMQIFPWPGLGSALSEPGSALCGPGSAPHDQLRCNATFYCPLQDRTHHAQAAKTLSLLNVNTVTKT